MIGAGDSISLYKCKLSGIVTTPEATFVEFSKPGDVEGVTVSTTFIDLDGDGLDTDDKILVAEKHLEGVTRNSVTMDVTKEIAKTYRTKINRIIQEARGDRDKVSGLVPPEFREGICATAGYGDDQCKARGEFSQPLTLETGVAEAFYPRDALCPQDGSPPLATFDATRCELLEAGFLYEKAGGKKIEARLGRFSTIIDDMFDYTSVRFVAPQLGAHYDIEAETAAALDIFYENQIDTRVVRFLHLDITRGDISRSVTP